MKQRIGFIVAAARLRNEGKHLLLVSGVAPLTQLRVAKHGDGTIVPHVLSSDRVELHALDGNAIIIVVVISVSSRVAVAALIAFAGCDDAIIALLHQPCHRVDGLSVVCVVTRPLRTAASDLLHVAVTVLVGARTAVAAAVAARQTSRLTLTSSPHGMSLAAQVRVRHPRLVDGRTQ